MVNKYEYIFTIGFSIMFCYSGVQVILCLSCAYLHICAAFGVINDYYYYYYYYLCQRGYVFIDICLFVCLFAGLRKTTRPTFTQGVTWATDEPVRLW